ncbi:Enoyl-[acyl-carrier-protein] reductase [NADH] [Rubrimonas cliftonensis]|uniref:Enoyl-[acyl-carrier-protein] reductase [NADH] n=2 Tax=Rubrimonas cliftonensis TaxID=89524 RepID=A0A1H3YD38_9RHOB|nr:Enoyl-[acyl-carrier-protein] reductase [NADH] [Rubrimonas cliftonensis]
MGVANDHSIAWGVARTLHAHGARIAISYQGEAFGRRVTPLAESIDAITVPADVGDPASLDAAFEQIAAKWETIDFIVHAIAYSDRNELQGRFANTTRENFLRSMDVSCYSFIDVTRRAAELMPNGGAALTMSYLGAERVMPNYNVMGVAKAALEASVRYLAADFGPVGVRVNALSPGPMRTLAGSAVGGARRVYKRSAETAPLRRNPTLDEVGGAALFLLSPLGGAVTGEVMFVDGGFHAVGMPPIDEGAA